MSTWPKAEGFSLARTELQVSPVPEFCARSGLVELGRV